MLTHLLRLCFFIAASTIIPLQVNAQKSGSPFTGWPRERYLSLPQRYAWPDTFTGFAIDLPAIRRQLQAAPLEFTPAAATSPLVFTLPMPDGGEAVFKLVETVTMDPALSLQYPDIKTYAGQGVTDPAALLRLSISAQGFHAMVLSPRGFVYIDPLQQGDVNDCIVYFKKDFKYPTGFFCEADERKEHAVADIKYPAIAAGQALRTHGTTLRTYRLALACTGEYTQFHGGTRASALAAMVASMNRVNGIYESEVAVRMVIIPNDTLIIYTDAATDPYSNTNGVAMLSENQTTIDAVIGNANYDVGHVFSTGGGGVASLNVPCVSGSKARGVTGSGSPVGDAFDVDYVAHEMGHQFGAFHTFNAVTGSCNGNRSATAAFEPGSGITIMAYAGICTSTNDLAPNSIAYFHTYSFLQITNFITTGSGNSCPVATATGNTPPNVVPAALNYTIPYQTPFTLTATGTDANGDALTYSWEELDLGAAGNWNAPIGDAPIFRPFPPVSSGARTFPRLSDIVDNTTTIGEILPSYARTLKFRITVRDNRLGGGGVMYPEDTIRVNIINTGAAFSVTSPNTALTWTAGQSATITWNVSGTSTAPVSCANVSILLSTDGGYTYPVTVLASTPNDGSETITVPSNITTTARIRIQAIGNIFFDISNVNFTIQSGAALLTTLSTNPITVSPICAGQTLSVGYAGNGPANAGNVFTAQLSNSAGAFTAPVSIGTLSATAATGTISCVIPAGTVQGPNYRIRVISSNPAVTGTNNGSNLTILNTVGTSGAITGAAAVCQGQSSIVYSIASVANATSYAWTVPSGFTITAGGTTNSITVSVSTTASSGSITVTPSNGCSTGSAGTPFAVTVNPLPAAAGSISGSASVCQGVNGVSYSVPVIANATSYNWVLPAGATIATGTGTNAITVNFSASASPGTITVNGTNACGSGNTSSFAVNLQAAAPAPVISATGATTICTGGAVTLRFTRVPGVMYQWRRNGVNLSGATDSFYVATTGGNYDVVAAVIPVGRQTFSNTSAVSIPDNSCTGGTSDITVSGYNFPVRSSGIYIQMNIAHTFVGDLDIFLESPSGARIGISDQTGNTNNAGDNFTNTVIADSGAAQIPASGAPYTGLYKPWSTVFTVTSCTGLTTTLTSFAGLGSGTLIPNGTWRLRAYDRFSTDVGTINSWSITFPYVGTGCNSNSNTIAVTAISGSAPVISGISPSSGTVGTPVTLSGSGFSGATQVSFNGIPALFTVVNSGQISTTVPAGATTGSIAVTNLCGTGNTAGNFTVLTTATLNVTLLIEGFYDPAANQMLSVSAPGVSDSVTIQLRQPVAPFGVLHSVKVPLNLLGQASVTIPGSFIGSSCYLVFRHRNSIETWSKLPVSITAVTSFNLSQ